jgi:hypothetical protein
MDCERQEILREVYPRAQRRTQDDNLEAPFSEYVLSPISDTVHGALRLTTGITYSILTILVLHWGKCVSLAYAQARVMPRMRLEI